MDLTDLHIFADLNIERSDDRYTKFKIYISKLILDSYEYSQVAHVTMHIIIIISISISISIQPLGRSGQRPEFSQATGMALVAASWASS